MGPIFEQSNALAMLARVDVETDERSESGETSNVCVLTHTVAKARALYPWQPSIQDNLQKLLSKIPQIYDVGRTSINGPYLDSIYAVVYYNIYCIWLSGCMDVWMYGSLVV